MVPWLWLLTRTSDCRIFQDKTIPEIIKKVFDEWKEKLPGLVHFEDKTDPKKYRKVDYCVQFRERDHDFVTRLMEQDGIFFYFKHEEKKDILVMGDSSQDHVPCPLDPKVRFIPNEEKLEGGDFPEDLSEAAISFFKKTVKQMAQQFGDLAKSAISTILLPLFLIPGLSGVIPGLIDKLVEGFLDLLGLGDRPTQDGVKIWREQKELRPGKYTQRDYQFQMSNTKLEFSENSVVQIGDNGELEVYDYPGAFAERFKKPDERIKDGQVEDEGRKLTKLRMEAETTPHHKIQGISREGIFTAGHRFELTNHPTANGEYVLISVEHFIIQSSDYIDGAEDAGGPYRNKFTCLPISLAFRPEPKTPKPVVVGLQSAVVVGPENDEIHTDKFGRVKVQFHWDREGKQDDNSTCFLRVTQMMAGRRWGAFFWPRVGQEVIVAFLDGDLDQPLVVGSVYNFDQMPPYLGDGPDDKHKNNANLSGFKTNSTSGGQGFNEFRFNDTKDQEQVFIHGQKDMDVRVLNDRRERIISNQHLIVGSEQNGENVGDDNSLVFGTSIRKVKNDDFHFIEGGYRMHVGGGDGRRSGTCSVVLDEADYRRVRSRRDLLVEKNLAEEIGGQFSQSVGGDHHEKVGSNYLLDAGGAIHIKAGANIVIEAGAQISLKVGGNFVDISQAGVAIKGSIVLINSGGAPGSAPDAQPEEVPVFDPKPKTEPDEADNAKTGNKSN